MHNKTKYLTATILLVLLYLYVMRNEVSYVSADNGKVYQVQDLPQKDNASNLLSILHDRMNKFVNYLSKNANKYSKFSKYIKTLHERTQKVILSENSPNNNYTTYTVDKGEQIVFCLRSKNTLELHDINLLTFVLIHELAHIACPEKHHTPLFVTIFTFFLTIAMELGLYNYQNYKLQPVIYCGMELNDTPIQK